MTPLLSIICVTLNAAEYLDEAAFLPLPGIQWVVKDGGSTDGTLERLRALGDRIDLVVAPDCSVYDAMNQAIDHAHGEWVLFMGADDRSPTC